MEDCLEQEPAPEQAAFFARLRQAAQGMRPGIVWLPPELFAELKQRTEPVTPVFIGNGE